MPKILGLIIVFFLSLTGYGAYRAYDFFQYPSRYAELKEEYEQIVREKKKLEEQNEKLQARIQDQEDGFRSLYE